MTLTGDALVARWRRLDLYLATVAAGQDDGGDAVPDAIAPALDEMYGLWEAWAGDAGLSFVQQDQHVAGDLGGETTAALVFARGARTHAGIEFGNRLGFGVGPFGATPFGAGGWHWQPYTDPNPRYINRNAWYAKHVEWQPVTPTLERACQWLRGLPTLRP